MGLAGLEGTGKRPGMAARLARLLAGRGLLLLALLWILAWLLPWTAWLEAFPWVRVGLAILLFAVPGLASSIMLAGGRFTLAAHFSIGLGISVFLAGLLGFVGRIFQWPFDYICPVFAAAGLAGILGLFYCARAGMALYKPKKYPPLTVALVLLMAALGSLAALQHRFGIDDFTYLAYLTNWQHAPQLNFREVYFGTQGLDHIRFWMAMFPIDLALLAEISRVPGLLLFGLYLEPLLVFVALLTLYNLYEDVLRSERLAVTALLLHFTFLFMRPALFITGTIFFNRLSHDKAFAAFVLAPVFFLAVRYFMEAYTRRSGLLVLILGLALVLTHPVMLAFCIFISGAYAVFVILPRKEYRKLALVLGLLAAIIIPSASQRVLAIPRVSRVLLGIDSPLIRISSFDLESALETNNIDTRISYIEGTPFYGFNPSTFSVGRAAPADRPLMVFLSEFPLWILGLGFLWSFFHLKQDAAPLIAASSLLVILCLVPYTGWLVGFFVSARQLARSAWLLPMGLIMVVLIGESIRWIRRSPRPEAGAAAGIGPVAQAAILAVCFLLVGYYSLSVYSENWSPSGALQAYRQNLEMLGSVGDSLEQKLAAPARIATNQSLRDYIPGISSKSKVAFFRQEGTTPWPVDHQEIDSLLAADPSLSIERRVRIMKKYQFQYILMRNGRTARMYADYPEVFQVEKVGTYWLVRLIEPVGQLEPVR
jgi:hypothetical protein